MAGNRRYSLARGPRNNGRQEGSVGQGQVASAGSRDQATDFEDFFENGSIALHIVDGSGTILRANRAELELLGYPAEDYVGRSIAEFHADQDVIQNVLARLKAGEKLDKVPARLRARDGSIKSVELTSSAHFRDGKFVNTRCFTVDVTDLVEARAQLREKDDQLRQVLDALPAAVYTTDADGKISYYNRAAAELAGREPEIGKDEWCVTFRLFTADGTELPHAECPMALALKENRPIRGVEALAQRPDGTLFPFLPFPTPLHDKAGALVGAVNMLVDISDRKQAETNQRLLLDELNHRVKNNLQMLHGLLQAACRESASAEARTVIGDASQRVAAMAAAQRTLYTESTPRSFHIGDFLRSVSASAQQSFGKEIAIQIDADAGQLSNDMAMPLALILNELLINAAKHGINGRGTGAIKVALKRAAEGIMLSVQDDGPGFDLRKTERSSSGLGLITGLTRQLRGTFVVERGAGARCIVRFPEQPGAR